MTRFVPCLFLLACGSNGSGTDGGNTDGASDGNTTMDGGMTDDSGVLTKFIGTVLVSSTNTASSMRYDVFGLFESTQTSMGGTCLPMVTEGSCYFIDCPSTTSSEAGTPTYLGAGTMNVSVGGTMIQPMPMGNGEYRATGAMPLFSGGENVRATATGDPMGAPAFDLSVVAASRIVVTSPQYPPVVPIPVPRSQPLAVSWTNGTAGIVYVSLTTYPMGRTNAISCKVGASMGSVAIGSALLSKMTAGNGFLGISVTTSASTINNDWGIYLATYNTAVDPNGKSVTLVNATVQ